MRLSHRLILQVSLGALCFCVDVEYAPLICSVISIDPMGAFKLEIMENYVFWRIKRKKTKTKSTYGHVKKHKNEHVNETNLLVRRSQILFVILN